eukprot:3158055-Amphidinium_carterae.3
MKLGDVSEMCTWVCEAGDGHTTRGRLMKDDATTKGRPIGSVDVDRTMGAVSGGGRSFFNRPYSNPISLVGCRKKHHSGRAKAK